VYRLSDEMALVMTADIITPPVDDPRVFGQIAAANALSDIYAMGGKPIACLNLIGFPQDELEPQVLEDIVAGGFEKITEAGAALAGGHTNQDDEPKYGLSVSGLVHPDQYWTNVGSRPGDVLLLTKRLGSGVLFNANRKGWVSDEAMEACIESLLVLNRAAAEAMAPFAPHAVTDVSGFGLAGHALEMAHGARVTFEIEFDALPLYEETLEMYERGVTTGVNSANRSMISPVTRFERDLPDWHREVVVDPQTSGGLLMSVAADQAVAAISALADAGVAAVQIGVVHEHDEVHLIFS
jgi:selenide,water dikinase